MEIIIIILLLIIIGFLFEIFVRLGGILEDVNSLFLMIRNNFTDYLSDKNDFQDHSEDK